MNERLYLLPLLAAALLGAPSARAQATDPAGAQSLFDAAKQLVAQGRIADACPKFLASYKLDPKPGTVVNLADCYEKNGQSASAWARYQEAATLAQRAGQAEREQYAKEHAAALEPRLSRITLTAPGAPPGLEVARDGAPVDLAMLGTAVAVDPGRHVIEARAPGKKPWTKTVELALGGAPVAVEIPALEDAPAGAPISAPAGGGAGAEPSPAPPSGKFWGTRRVAGAVVGAVGLGGVAAGAVLGAVTLGTISASKSQDHCNAALTVCDATGLQMLQSAHGLSHGSTAALVVGGAAVVTGAVLLAIGGPAPPKTGLRLSIGPVAGVEMKGALLRGGW